MRPLWQTRRAAGPVAVRTYHSPVGANGLVTTFVRLHPLLPVPPDVLDAAGDVIHHGETVSVELTHSLQEMWHGTRRDHHNHINRAQRARATSPRPGTAMATTPTSCCTTRYGGERKTGATRSSTSGAAWAVESGLGSESC